MVTRFAGRSALHWIPHDIKKTKCGNTWQPIAATT